MSARDTQFACFAQLLFDELNTQSLLAFPTMYGPDHTSERHKELKALIEHIVAQRAYDFACHVATHTITSARGDMSNIPDMTNWPEN